MLSRDHALAGVLMAGSLALVGAGATYVTRNAQPRVTLDADQCPPVAVATTIAAVDITDPLAPHEQKRITAALATIAERMQKHERLALHVIAGTANVSAAPIPLPDRPQGFDLCKPADPKSVNRHLENERLARQRYQRDFLTPLLQAAPHLVRGGKAKTSPILEAVETMMWSPQFRATVPQRTLVLFSDLQQNSDVASHLSGRKPDACAISMTPLGQRLARHNWRGVRVVLHYLRNPRDARYQSPAHLLFSTDLFNILGAEVFDGDIRIAKTPGYCEMVVDPEAKPKSKTARKG